MDLRPATVGVTRDLSALPRHVVELDEMGPCRIAKMRSLSQTESALTTETRRHAGAGYLEEFWSNFPPACSSVMTISAAERLNSSSSLISVGSRVRCPRRRSSVRVYHHLDVVAVPSQRLVDALSTTSKPCGAGPCVGGIPDVHPRALAHRVEALQDLDAGGNRIVVVTPVSAARILCCVILFPVVVGPARRETLDAHRHHDVLEFVVAGHLDEGARIRVAMVTVTVSQSDGVEHVER